MKPTNTHGGSRKGAGRPRKEPTKQLNYRVPVSLAPVIDKEVKVIIQIIKNSKK